MSWDVIGSFIGINDNLLAKAWFSPNIVSYEDSPSIKNKDLNGLQKIGSIGAKADRIYYELKNKVVNLEGYNYKYPDVFDALINLGYKAQEIFPILNNLEGNLDSSSALKEVIVRLKDNE